MLNIAICGATGRMGNLILSLCCEDKKINVVGATVRVENPFCNKPLSNVRSVSIVNSADNTSSKSSASNKSSTHSAHKSDSAHNAHNTKSTTISENKNYEKITITDSLLNSNEFDVAIDFTTPLATIDHIQECLELKKPIVIGTTGFNEEQLKFINEAGKAIPIIYAPNMSLGVNLMYKLLKVASNTISNTIGSTWDIAISEKHHKNKADSPSGTALEMGKIISKNSKNSKISADNIKYNSLRLANLSGEHTVTFASDNETIEITHNATDRIIFAKGALTAAKWICDKSANLYKMEDVISS